MHYILKKAFRNGHKYWDAKDGRVYVSDDSGSTPDDTEDGPCWLDFSRPLKLVALSVTVTQILVPLNMLRAKSMNCHTVVCENSREGRWLKSLPFAR